MTLLHKIKFTLLKALRMAWFGTRYSIYKWKKIEGIDLPVSFNYGYSVLRFIDNSQYEQGEISIIKNTLQKDDIVLELGTGMGFVSAYCARRIGNENVFTYEANKELASCIERLYNKNKVKPNVTFAMLGENTGTKLFYRDTQSFLSSSSQKNNTRTQKALEIPLLDLNKIIKELQPTFLIMDIEGGEYDIFKIINFQSIIKIQFELHPTILGGEKVRTIFDKLRDNDFVKDENYEFENNFYFSKQQSNSLQL